jgi:hypothetical protein
MVESMPSAEAAALVRLVAAIDGAREALTAIEEIIAVMPETQRRVVIPIVLSAAQSLGDLYAEFGMEMLRMLSAHGTA